MFKKIMAIILIFSTLFLTVPVSAQSYILAMNCTHQPMECIDTGMSTNSRVLSSRYYTLTTADYPDVRGKHVCTFIGWATTYDDSRNRIVTYEVGDTVDLATETNGRSLCPVYASPQKAYSQTDNYFYTWVPPSQKRFIEFTPTTTATYVFYSSSSTDTYGYIYSADCSELNKDDDSGDGTNFLIERTLYAGTKYYLAARWYNSSYNGNMSLYIKRQYNISYNANGGSGAPSSQTKLHGNILTLSSTKPVRNLWQFKGWATSSTATSAQYQAGRSYSANGNQTLYAVWGYPTGSCGTNATWTFSPENNSLTISGSGAMNDYSGSNPAPWIAYLDHINTISIAEGITSIGNYAFSGCNKVTNVTLPNSVKDIGEYAFSGCTKLEKVNIPSGVTSIEKYTFNYCVALSAPVLPETVTSIGEYAFSGCSAMTTINLPAAVKTIGTYAFSGCSKLQSITIPSGVTTIEPYTFNGNTKLNTVVIADTVKTIKEYAFVDCAAISSVVIPESVTEIQRGAFLRCAALDTITIPDSVTTIGTGIFSYDSDVTIKCYLNTVAHQYAQANNFSYEIMSWGILESVTFEKTDIVGGVSVSLVAPKGTIYYTTNGAEPTINDKNLYKGPITAKKSMTIKAFVVEDGWDNSAVTEFCVELQKVTNPYANTPSGTVMPGTKISLYCDTEGAEIWYTTDENIPTESDVYTGEFEITEDTIVYAFAVKKGMLNSVLTTYYYEVSKAQDVPSVFMTEAKNITETSAQLSASAELNGGTLQMTEFKYFEKNNSKMKYTVESEGLSTVITGLTPNTEYWYQVRVKNEINWSPWSAIEIFETDARGIIKPTSVEIEPAYVKMNLGKKKTLLATVLPATAQNREVYWSSEDPDVVTVDENGVVTAVGLGNTRVKATTVSNRLVAYCNVDVVSLELKGEFDFSEHHMITNSSYLDEYGFNYHPNKGGNALMASAYLARWDGVVSEENDPYPYTGKVDDIKYHGNLSADYHVQNILYLPYRSHDLDNDEIKNAIMKYGAVYSSFKLEQDDVTLEKSYFNEDESSYYYPQNAPAARYGHAIAIIGWDDNYSRANFETTPPGDGAFICKNSWGTNSGEDGYFYISYYDKYLGKYVVDPKTGRPENDDYNAVFYHAESADNYNKIYQYDYLGPTLATNEFGEKELYAANVFPEAGSALQEKELLKAVSFYNYAPGMAYEVYVVTNYQNQKSLENLGPVLKTGVSEYAGYLTVNLDNPIELAKGTRFAVVVKTTANTGNVMLFMEFPLEGHASNARANKDESYIGMDKKTWMDMTEHKKNTNLCIKAFTETDDTSVFLQGIDNIGREYESDKVYSIDEMLEAGYDLNEAFVDYIKSQDSVELFATDSEYTLGSIPPPFIPDLNTNHNYAEGAELPSRYDLREEECMTSVKNQGEIGSCWAFATYASLESSLKKASFLSIGNSGDGLNQSTSAASSIHLDTSGTKIALGNTYQLKASLQPVDSTAELIWTSSNNQVLSVSSRGLVTGLGIGQAVVTVCTTDGKTSAQCTISVTVPVSVDNVTINNTEPQVVAGNKLLLDYSVYPENAGDKTIIWEVDNPSVASVNEYGLLTAKSGGNVTVTAYSADRRVSDTYTLFVDDGFDCNIEIIDNNLGVYDTNIFGSVEANITNKTSKTIENASVVMSVFDSHGTLVKVLPSDKTLLAGDNEVIFKNIYISGLTDKKFTVKLFVWNKLSELEPLAVSKEEEVE